MARTKRATAGNRAAGAAPPSRPQRIRDLEETWRALSAAVTLFQTRSAAQRGLAVSDLQAIDMLAREDTVCARDLADACGLTPGAITGMLDRLERAGVAHRTRDEADARRVVVRATEARPGSECLLPQAFRKVAASFTDQELESIRRFLLLSADALKREAETLRDDPR